MKHIYIPASIALTALLTACNSAPDYDATGIFEATTVTVSAETSGKILRFDINEGDSIIKGQQVAAIDTAVLVLQQKQILSQQQSARSSSPDIAAQVASLRDKTRTSISDNAAALMYQSEQIAEQILKSRITSPLTGTVLVKYAEPGEFATPGKPLFKAANLNDVYLRAYFTANQLADIKLGQKVTVIADFGGDEQYEYPGTITWIAEESEFTPKSIQTRDSRANLVYAVKISVRNDGRLKLGQYGEVRL